MTQRLRPVGGRDDPLLTVAEAAEIMNTGERTVWDLIRTKKISSVGIPSARGRGERKLRRIRRSEIDRFLSEHTDPAQDAS